MKLNITEKLGRISDQNRLYLFIGVLIFVFLLDYLMWMKPNLAMLAKITPENKVLSGDIQKAEGDIQRLESYKGEAARLKAGIEEMNLKIKSKDEVSMILEHVSLLADQNKVDVDQIMPSSHDQHVLLEEEKRVYLSLPILVEARSGYHDFGRFLNDIEQDHISLGIRSFSVTATSDTQYHAVRLTLEAIVFEEEQK